MRSSNLDKYVCIAVLFLFLYSFFIIGSSLIFCPTEINIIDNPNSYWGYTCREDEVTGIEWPTSVFIAPVAFMMFFAFMLFSEELKPVNRFWMRKKIRYGFSLARRKMRSGLEEYREWKS